MTPSGAGLGLCRRDAIRTVDDEEVRLRHVAVEQRRGRVGEAVAVSLDAVDHGVVVVGEAFRGADLPGSLDRRSQHVGPRRRVDIERG